MLTFGGTSFTGNVMRNRPNQAASPAMMIITSAIVNARLYFDAIFAHAACAELNGHEASFRPTARPAVLFYNCKGRLSRAFSRLPDFDVLGHGANASIL